MEKQADRQTDRQTDIVQKINTLSIQTRSTYGNILSQAGLNLKMTFTNINTLQFTAQFEPVANQITPEALTNYSIQLAKKAI